MLSERTSEKKAATTIQKNMRGRVSKGTDDNNKNDMSVAIDVMVKQWCRHP